MDKNELIAAALPERIAALVSMYERQMAEFRADATVRMNALEAERKHLMEQLAQREPSEASRTVIQGEVVEDPLEGRDGPG